MIIKSLKYVLKGILGIFINPNYSLDTKLKLCYDYFRLLIILFMSFFTPFPTTIYLSAFKLRVSFVNIYSFIFMFNETFCIGQYKIYKNIKVFIDVGANIGLVTLWYHLFNPKMEIYCFEPDEINFRILQKNIKDNQVTNCHIFKNAVSNKSCTTKFYRIKDNIQNLDSGLRLNLKLPYETINIDTIKLSTLIKKLTKVSLLKMDIEGEEYAVIDELFYSDSIKKIDKIIFESHIFSKKDRGKYLNIISKLKKAGKLHSAFATEYSSMNFWERSS